MIHPSRPVGDRQATNLAGEGMAVLVVDFFEVPALQCWLDRIQDPLAAGAASPD
jgi:hypothetical protein